MSTATIQRVTFPPFPPAPNGVKIIPFSEFEEVGIKVSTGCGEPEEDALGIKTVRLRTKHDTDRAPAGQTLDQSSKLAEPPTINTSSTKPSQTWWDAWEEKDSRSYGFHYDTSQSQLSRLQKASTDFKQSRSWPAMHTGVSALWDQFRIFTGLLHNPLIGRKTKNVPVPDENEDEVESDDEFAVDVPLSVQVHPFTDGDNYSTDAMESSVSDPAEFDKKSPEYRMAGFLKNPEMQTQIFLSSHMRKQGLLWAERNLTAVPRLVSFFLGFLIRNRVFPDANEVRFQRALAVSATALIELPKTNYLSKTLPDRFSSACVDCWGEKTDSFTPYGGSWAMDVDKVSTNEVPAAAPSPVASHPAPPTWGGGDSNWGEDATFDDPWGEPSTETDNVSDWSPPKHSLMELLGPTCLPLTHTTGAVETGMRKVLTISQPVDSTLRTKSSVADMVEEELNRRFAKVTLTPLTIPVAVDEPQQLPELLSSSRGSSHNPMMDDIVLLLDPTFVPSLDIGMGFKGTWVQIVREVDDSTMTVDSEVPSYWYLEGSLQMVVPSFQT